MNKFNAYDLQKKNPFDDTNESFMAAQDQYVDTQLDQGIPFMDILGDSLTGFTQQPIPFAPGMGPAEEERDIASSPDPQLEQELQEQALNSVTAAPNASPSPALPAVPQRYQEYIDAMKKMREADAGRVGSARMLDNTNQLANNMNKVGAQLNKAFSNRAGFTKIEPEAIDYKTQAGATAESDSVKRQASLLQEYKILSDADREKANQMYRQRMLEMQQSKDKRADEYLEEKRNTEKRVLRNQQIQNARGFLKDDPMYKATSEQMMGFQTAKNALEAAKGGSETAVAALGTTLAKAMGEKGMLTDQDVTRYIKPASWLNQLKTYGAKGATGTLPRSVLKDIENNIGNIENVIKSKEKQVFDRASSRMKTAYPDLEDDVIAGLMGYEGSAPSSSSAPNGQEIVERNGKTYRWNPSVKKYQLFSK